MNLSNKISSDDVQRVKDIRNHPQYDTEFDDNGSDGDNFGDLFGDSGGDSMDDLFGDDDFSFGDDNNSGFGGDSGFGNDSGFGGDSGFGNSNGFGGNSGFGNSNGFGNSGFGNNNGFGSSGFGNSGFGQQYNSPFGQTAGATPGQNQPDRMDAIMDAGVDAAKTTGEILVELAKSIKLRNIDDFGFLSRNCIIVGGLMAGIGLVSTIIGGTSGMDVLSITGMGGNMLLCGGLLGASGIIGIGASALILDKVGASEIGNIEEDLPDIPADDKNNVTQEYEDNIGDELDDLFSSDELDAELFGSDETDDTLDDITETEPDIEEEEEEEFIPDIDIEPQELNLEGQLNNIGENQVITRQTLFNTFVPLFPTCTPQFAEKKDIDTNSDDFSTLETICLKALSNLANVQIEELNSHLESANETFFSYELRVKRVNKVKKVDELAREIEVYMRDDADDDSVNATVSIEGDFYKILVTKGVSAIVTFGDVFKHQYCKDFFLNTKNKLPMICGIDELGKVILGDAKGYDTMLIAGKPRSGKSWYVLSILMSLMLFNSPEEVQFIIIDPKEANLFNTMSLMPHVAGLHNDEHILDILDDIIENEAPRRKQLIANNRVDDIWGLRKKGIQLPVLYVVIDEYITVINNLKGSDDKDAYKDFNTKIQVLISQLPSLGIRLIFVPHRATGIVDKTNRTMIQYSACVRSEIADAQDTLGDTKWNRALTKPGDIGIKNSEMKKATYVRGAALTTDDNDNAIFMETAAKAFYKMGVSMPDMSTMRVAVNRDENKIQAELGGQNVIQYNAMNLEEEASGDLTLDIDNSDIIYNNSSNNNINNSDTITDNNSDNSDSDFDDDFDDDLEDEELLDDDDIDVDF